MELNKQNVQNYTLFDTDDAEFNQFMNELIQIHDADLDKPKLNIQYSTSSSGLSDTLLSYQSDSPDSVSPGTPEILSGIEDQEPLDLSTHLPDCPYNPSQSLISDIEEYHTSSSRIERIEIRDT